MGIEPNRLGPHVWAAIHLCCIGAPDVLDSMQQVQYRSFFMSLPYVIPCTNCSDHFKKVLQTLPVDNKLTGKDDLFRWSVDVHNNVNARLNKPIIAYEDAYNYWKTICDNDGSIKIGKNKGVWTDIGLFPILLALVMTYSTIAYYMHTKSRS